MLGWWFPPYLLHSTVLFGMCSAISMKLEVYSSSDIHKPLLWLVYYSYILGILKLVSVQSKCPVVPEISYYFLYTMYSYWQAYKNEIFTHYGWKCEMVNHFRKKFGNSSKSEHVKSLYDSEIPLLGINQENWK